MLEARVSWDRLELISGTGTTWGSTTPFQALRFDVVNIVAPEIVGSTQTRAILLSNRLAATSYVELVSPAMPLSPHADDDSVGKLRVSAVRSRDNQ